MRKIGDVTVNDGKGLYDNIGLVDTLITDLNSLPGLLASGQAIKAAGVVYFMGQKLGNLKKGIQADLDSKNQIIEELKKINDSLMEEKTGLPVDRSDDNGTD